MTALATFGACWIAACSSTEEGAGKASPGSDKASCKSTSSRSSPLFEICEMSTRKTRASSMSTAALSWPLRALDLVQIARRDADLPGQELLRPAGLLA